MPRGIASDERRGVAGQIQRCVSGALALVSTGVMKIEAMEYRIVINGVHTSCGNTGSNEIWLSKAPDRPKYALRIGRSKGNIAYAGA